MAGNETNERPSPSSSLSNYYEWNPQLHLTLVFIAVTILLVNIPIVFVFLKMPSLRFSAGNTFLFGLAIADILCGLVMIPSALLCELGLSVFSPRGRVAFCSFYNVVSYSVSVASVYHIIAASVAKYSAIVFPMKNITRFTTSRVKYVIFAIWLTSFVIGHVPIYWPYMSEEAVQKIILIHAYFLLVFVLFIPTIILIFIHLHIYFNLFMGPRGTSLTTGKSVQRLNNPKIVGLFLLLFLVFLISWLPWYLMNISWLDYTDDFLITLRFLAPILNPIIFTFAKRDFRKAVLMKLRGRKSKGFSVRSSNNATKIESSFDNGRTSTVDQSQAVRR